jgi:hypothetical protein
MKARVAWYAVTQCAISDDIQAVCGIVGSIDRYAFWLSVITGIGGWLYISGRRIPAAFYTAYRKRLRRFLFLCTAATGALIVSVISDGLLTALRLPGTQLSAEFLLPVPVQAKTIVPIAGGPKVRICLSPARSPLRT